MMNFKGTVIRSYDEDDDDIILVYLDWIIAQNHKERGVRNIGTPLISSNSFVLMYLKRNSCDVLL